LIVSVLQSLLNLFNIHVVFDLADGYIRILIASSRLLNSVETNLKFTLKILVM